MSVFSPWTLRALTLTGAVALLVSAPLAASAAQTTHAVTTQAQQAAPQARQVTDAPGTLSAPAIDTITDDSAPVFVTVNIPAGLSPASASATLAPQTPSSTGIPGSVQVSVKGEVRQSIDPTAPAAVSIPLSASDVVDGQVAIGFTYLPATPTSSSTGNAACVPPSGATASLSAVTVAVTGEATAPTTVGDFFSPALNAVSVVVPDAPTAALKQAGLAAVGSLAHAFPSSVAISLSTAGDTGSATSVEPERGRVVAFVASGDTVTTQLSTGAAGVPTLTISGPEAELAAAGAALGSDYLALADAGDVSGLTQTGQVPANLVQSLQSLGAGNELSLSGYGQTGSVVNVDQSAFGGPVSEASVHLLGMHSDIPDTVTATMNVYWNSYLIGSSVLGHTPAFDVTLPVAATRLTASNALRVSLSAESVTGECSSTLRSIPIELFVDNKASTVTATRGQSLDAGFQRFPQALGGTLPVAFGAGLADSAAVAAAGDLVASLQRNSSIQLAVTVMSAADFAGSSQPGLIVGATTDDSSSLKAPLRLDSFKAIDSSAVSFGVGSTSPYAALESFESSGRNIVMLGGWAPDGSTSSAIQQLQRQAADYAVSNPGAWFGLSGDVIIAQPGLADPVALSSNAIVPQAAVTSEYNRYAIWAVVIIVVLVFAAAIGEFTRRRRRAKLKKYVDAQLVADRERTDAAAAPAAIANPDRLPE